MLQGMICNDFLIFSAKHSYLKGMVMKPVRLLCCIFLLAFLDLTFHNVQLAFLWF